MALYFRRNFISHDTALKIIEASIEEGNKLGVAISAAIVDPSMTLIAFVKTDGSSQHSVETSRRKANTAVSTKKPTGWMNEGLDVTLPLASDNLLTNVPGGYPIIFDGQVVGGLGIAGGTVDQDHKIVKFAISKIGAEFVDDKDTKKE